MSEISESRDFENIYGRNVDTVYRLCYTYLGNLALSREKTKETFLRFAASEKRFDDEKAETAWLLVTAARLCSRPGNQESNVPLPDPEEIPGNDILNALTELPDEDKLAAYLYYYEGYSTMEIAQYLRSSASKIRGQLAQIRGHMKQELGSDTL